MRVHPIQYVIMKKVLSEKFIERLKHIIPNKNFEDVMARFSSVTPVTIRINTIKKSLDEVFSYLEENKLIYHRVPWCPFVFTADPDIKNDKQITAWLNEGILYQQNLSSILVVKILDPHPDERILDLCAAPGSKTGLMAAMMKNTGHITAVEVIRQRFYKLRSVMELIGAVNVDLKIMDGRRFRTQELYDRVLVDASCSCEGRFNLNNPKTLGYWSLRKIKEMVHKQRGLLLTASRALKPGGTLVYSTCTFAPEENEGVLSWLLRKAPDLSLGEAQCYDISTYPCITEWFDKKYNSQVKKSLRILPQGVMDAFFIAKIQKGKP